MRYIKGKGLIFEDEEIAERAKDSALEIGNMFQQDRILIEEIGFGNATAYYSYGHRSFPWEKDENDETLERKVIYYHDDAGLIFKSYMERRDGKYLATDLNFDDTVTVTVVGMIPTHNNNDLVF